MALGEAEAEEGLGEIAEGMRQADGQNGKRGREENHMAREKKLPWWFRKKEEPREAEKGTDYTVISSVGEGLVRLLKEQMIPAVLPGGEAIGLCRPSEHGDFSLGLCLYDVQEFGAVREDSMRTLDDNYQQFPSMYLTLYYMVTAYSNSELQYRSEEEQRILGKVMQVFYDHPVLDARTLRPVKQMDGEELHIEYLNLETEEKMKIWGGMGSPYRLSSFYRVAPVELESTLRREISRVKELHIRGEEQW